MVIFSEAVNIILVSGMGWRNRKGCTTVLPALQFSHFRDSNKNHTYELLPGVHHYTIPRSDFVLFSEMEIYVKAVNELGEATSVPITLEPVSAGET